MASESNASHFNMLVFGNLNSAISKYLSELGYTNRIFPPWTIEFPPFISYSINSTPAGPLLRTPTSVGFSFLGGVYGI